ncbi:hypothetical protein LINPERHAP1_LOCUS34510 [Linum perenne]
MRWPCTTKTLLTGGRTWPGLSAAANPLRKSGDTMTTWWKICSR